MHQDRAEYWKLGNRRYNTEPFGVTAEGELSITSGGQTHSVLDLVRQYGTPLQIFLPEVAEERATRVITAFGNAMRACSYPGTFTYMYPLKASQRRGFVEAVVRGGAQLETSSENELLLIKGLYEDRNPRPRIICNGPKSEVYINLIKSMWESGWNIIPIFNDEAEVKHFQDFDGEVGLRLDLTVKNKTGDWQKKHNFYGLSESVALALPRIPNLVMVHYHLSSQVDKLDSFYEPVERAVELFAQLKVRHELLRTLNIGGGAGLPYTKVPYYSTEELVERIISTVCRTAHAANIAPPDIMCEWGQHVIAPAQLTIFKITRRKEIEDAEAAARYWYAIDGSFMSNLPDSWGITQAWHITPVSNLLAPNLVPVWLSGGSCDSDDQYPKEPKEKDGKRHDPPFLPLYEEGDEYYAAFFDTGAYQNALSSHHCLLPSAARICVQGGKDTLLRSRETTEELGQRFEW
jgi:arginine decarboxylase